MQLWLENDPVFFLVMESENVVLVTSDPIEAQEVADMAEYRQIIRCTAENGNRK
ncbi:hypothetical protein [Roseibium alexandrii]|uniref:hypothetical protein n=1 Tax=Roseibium alexandrii TaxID=388408 RepID=UPI003751FBF0